MVVRLWLFLACAAAALAPRVARACSCIGPGWIEPRDGATDVPVNTKLWRVSYEGDRAGTTFRLVGPTGDVELDALELPVTNLPPGYFFRHVLTPKQPLTPGAKYRLLICASGSCRDGEGFTVGTRRLDFAALPREQSRQPIFVAGQPNSSCGPEPTRLVAFRFDWSGMAILWDVDGDNHFSPTTMQDLLKHSYPLYLYEHSVGGLPIGSGPCLPGLYDASGNPLTNPHLRFGVLDLAGNFSGWTTAQQVSLPTAPLEDAGVDSAITPDSSVTPDSAVAPDASPPPGFALFPDASAPDVPTAKVAPRIDAAPPTPADAAIPPGPDGGSALPEPPALADDGCSCRVGGGPRRPGALTLVLLSALVALRRSRRSRIDLRRPGESDR
jgi:MYXO-CTERM domain-containing protein